MSDKIIGEFFKQGGIGLIDEEYLVLDGDESGAESGDMVEAINISENPNTLIYKIVKVINETKEKTQNIIEGYFKGNKNGFGFIKVLGEKEEYFVSSQNTLGAETGDKIRAILGVYNGKKEALVTEIINKRVQIFTGEINKKDNKSFIILDSGENIEISDRNLKSGDIISYTIEQKENKKIALLKEKLGDKNDLGIQTIMIAAENGARIHFPSEVLEEANNLDGNIDQKEIANRMDLRGLFTVTIDGPTAKDKDDAISVEVLGNGDYKLYVSIADVTHYVKENYAIDNEALLRGTSLYYGDNVTPIIPERLSNDICSLNPNTDKLTVTCEVYINSNGDVDLDKSKVYYSIIKSNHAITYEEVDNINLGKIKKGDKLMFGGKVNKDLLKLVKNGFILSEKLGKKFKQDGKLALKSSETKIKIDENKKPIGVEEYPKFQSNELIENFMVIANNIVPQLMERKLAEIKGLENKNLPFVHRTHGKPNESAVEKLNNLLNILEIDFEIKDTSSKTFSQLLDFVKGHEKELFLNKKITTTLQKAIYTSIREGHFGLALDYYSHFTSPIRRYPDLQIHRIIKEIISGNFDIDRFNHYNDLLFSIAESSTIKEEMSEKNEADVNNYLGFHLLKDKMGEKFEGYIDDIVGTKIKIVLDNTVKGFIDLSKNKNYSSEKLYEGIFKIINEKTKEEILLGDRIKVILDEAKEEDLELFFRFDK